MAHSLFFLFFLYFTLTTGQQTNPNKPNFTAAFFFGDSILDTGNNGFLPILIKSNHPPYGIDFTGNVPTGRFSNGLLVPDLLSSALGIKQLSPPFLDPRLSNEDIHTGVNFASAGSGYDDLTSVPSNTIPISKQLRMFDAYVARLKGIVGEEEASRILGNALIMFSAGSNDITINFYSVPRRRGEFTLSGYQDFLLQILEGAIKNLYNHGGRKFLISGLPPIGCVPAQISLRFPNPLDRRCVDEVNSDAAAYNSKLQELLPKVQQSLPGSKLAYSDLNENVIDMLNNPAKYGLEETRRGCCGTGFFEIGAQCNIQTPVCRDRSTFAFFDAVHPSERIYKLVTEQIVERITPQLL